MYKIIEITDRIFFLRFKESYDCGMFFCRYQEFLENQSDLFRGKPFELFDFMEYYSKKYGEGSFTYPSDWRGFNFSSEVIDNVFKLGILDKNKYDYEMLILDRELKRRTGNKSYYLIGSAEQDNDTLAHEVAHGLYFTNPSYRLEIVPLIEMVKPKLKQKIFEWLDEVGYSDVVWNDELQAYIATGMAKSSKIRVPKSVYKPFLEVYKKYTRNILELVDWKRPKLS